MPAPLIPKAEVIRRLSGVFRSHGFDGASLQRLSEATGLGRSSLYHYFPKGKEDMGAAVLLQAAEWLSQHVLSELEKHGDPRKRLRAASQALITFYDSGRRSCLLELFSTGEARSSFGRTIAEHIRKLTEAYTKVGRDAGMAASEAEMRAEDALISIQGALVLARALDDPGPFLRAVRELPDHFLRAA